MIYIVNQNALIFSVPENIFLDRAKLNKEKCFITEDVKKAKKQALYLLDIEDENIFPDHCFIEVEETIGDKLRLAYNDEIISVFEKEKLSEVISSLNDIK